MKLIIIEGCDNLGKSTLISNLVKYYNQKYNIIVKHSGKPSSDIDPLIEQYNNFMHEVNDIKLYKNIEKNDKKETIIIYDRFVQGEYVWGSMYRNYSLDDIKNKCVKPVIENILSIINQSDIVSILLDASSKFIYYNDDGNSFSSFEDEVKSTKLIDKQREIFNNIMTKPEYFSFDNNIIYNIQNNLSESEDENFEFKNEYTICNDIIRFINEKIHLE